MNASLLALHVLRVAGSGLLLLNALSFWFLSAPAKKDRPSSSNNSPITPVIVRVNVPRRTLILSLISLAALTYFLDGLTVVLVAVLTRKWQPSSPEWKGADIGDIFGLAAFAAAGILLLLNERRGVDVWTAGRVRIFALVACVFDIAIVFLMGFNIDFCSRDGGVRIPELPENFQVSIPQFSHLALAVLRLLFSIPLLTALSFPRHAYVSAVSQEAESQEATSSTALLMPDAQTPYGTFTTHTNSPAITTPSTPVNGTRPSLPKPKNPVKAKEEITLDPTWAELLRRLRRLGPYLIPRHNRALQGLALLCIGLLLVGRFINFLMPLTLGRLVGVLEGYFDAPRDGSYINTLYLTLLLYAGLRFLQSPGGLSAIRDSLWTPVMQYSDRNMSQLTFNHLLNLSLAFHTRRKTGEVLRILDRGAAINHILELLLFNVGPTILDMLVALAFFFVYYDWSLALIILVVMVLYIYASIALTTKRTKIRRKMVEADVETRGIHNDCLLNYETVKYFGGEAHEAARYADAIAKFQVHEYSVTLSLNLLNFVQTSITTLGLLAGSVIVARNIVDGKRRPADFVVFITYLSQLYGPLNQLGYIYRSINQSLVDTEKLMKLLDEPKDIVDAPDASELTVDEGVIQFENVSFGYDARKKALDGVTFTVPRGGRVALVGESGSGKSTILRLLYRFYDLEPGKGRILIDGKDIRDVTQQSLRKAIGVVPQDSVLFNQSIKMNIGYGKFDASDEEIQSAAKLAQMHDRIMAFPDEYATIVGERGVRLSGGEKQRVAIARTLLKNPPILLLDEATSALDTSTERDIQKALQNLVLGRSSLSIAHRLSTISNADIILVLQNGRIVEQGSHKELLEQKGVFAKMWTDQINADRRQQSLGSPTKEGGFGYTIGDVAAITEEPNEVAIEIPQPDTDITSDTVLTAATLVDEPLEEANVIIEDSPESDKPTEKNEPELEQSMATEGPKDDEVQHTQKPTYAAVAASEPVDKASAMEVAEDPSSGPAEAISFPIKSDDASSQHAPSSIASPSVTPGVTFSPGVDSPPSRSNTPDPDMQPKRKRISSQNFQRLARRISFGPRKSSQGSAELEAGKPSVDDMPAETSTQSTTGESASKGKKEKKNKKKGTK